MCTPVAEVFIEPVECVVLRAVPIACSTST